MMGGDTVSLSLFPPKTCYLPYYLQQRKKLHYYDFHLILFLYCLTVCLTTEIYEWTDLYEIFGWVGSRPSNKQSHFGGEPYHDPDIDDSVFKEFSLGDINHRNV